MKKKLIFTYPAFINVMIAPVWGNMLACIFIFVTLLINYPPQNMFEMKRQSVLLAAIFTSFLISNTTPGKADKLEKRRSPADVTAPRVPLQASNVVPDSIDLSKVPFSEKELAGFPVFDPPAGIIPLNKPLTRDFDRVFFPTREGMVPLEGKVYKAFLTNVTGKEWSLPYFEKSYKDLITAAGGVLIFQGKVPQKELDRIKDEAAYFGEEGSIDYANTLVKVYAIRRKGGDHLFVQFSGYSSGGSIQILQLPEKTK